LKHNSLLTNLKYYTQQHLVNVKLAVIAKIVRSRILVFLRWVQGRTQVRWRAG